MLDYSNNLATILMKVEATKHNVVCKSLRILKVKWEELRVFYFLFYFRDIYQSFQVSYSVIFHIQYMKCPIWIIIFESQSHKSPASPAPRDVKSKPCSRLWSDYILGFCINFLYHFLQLIMIKVYQMYDYSCVSCIKNPFARMIHTVQLGANVCQLLG